MSSNDDTIARLLAELARHHAGDVHRALELVRDTTRNDGIDEADAAAAFLEHPRAAAALLALADLTRQLAADLYGAQRNEFIDVLWLITGAMELVEEEATDGSA